MTEATGSTDLGTRLRQARERRGISLRQIATSTKISIGVLEALERNDFSKLPGGIFGRAFVRSYAQEVGVDPEQTVEEFLASLPSESPSPASDAATRHVNHGESAFESQQRMAGVALKLGLVSLPIAALILYLTLGRGGRPPAATEAASPPPSPVVRSQPIAPVAQMPIAQVPDSGAATETAIAGTEAATRPQSSPAAEAEGVLLEVAPSGACWVSLTVDGALVLSRVMQPGERVARRIREGALVQVGDAGAFAFTLNGRDARPLGGPGEVRSVRVTPDNYQTFLR
jgi:cytoskeletal protein RodZ